MWQTHPPNKSCNKTEKMNFLVPSILQFQCNKKLSSVIIKNILQQGSELITVEKQKEKLIWLTNHCIRTNMHLTGWLILGRPPPPSLPYKVPLFFHSLFGETKCLYMWPHTSNIRVHSNIQVIYCLHTTAQKQHTMAGG